ncbi:hypothetical protein ACKKBF_B38410 [Auxenochlorella protothecoides x Auxenochlorella symbiontica]
MFPLARNKLDTPHASSATPSSRFPWETAGLASGLDLEGGAQSRLSQDPHRAFQLPPSASQPATQAGALTSAPTSRPDARLEDEAKRLRAQVTLLQSKLELYEGAEIRWLQISAPPVATMVELAASKARAECEARCRAALTLLQTKDEALSALQARMREAVAGAQTAAASSQAAQVRADASGMRVGELAAALAAARARAEEDGGRATLRITELEGKCAQLEERMHSEAQAARREADARVAQAAQTQAEAVERLTAEVRRLKDAGQATAAEEEEWQEERRACQMRGEDASPLSPAVDRVQQPAPDPPRRATPSESPSGMFSALRRDAAAVSAALRGGSIPAAKVALDHLQATLTRAEGEVSEALGQPSTIAETLVDLDADAEWSISAATPQSKLNVELTADHLSPIAALASKIKKDLDGRLGLQGHE